LQAVGVYGITKLFADGGLSRNLRTGIVPFSGKPAKDFKEAKLEDYNPQDGQGEYQYLEAIVARHGFTVQPVGSRDGIAVVAPELQQGPTFALVRHADAGKPGNLTEQSKASVDYEEAPTVVIAKGRAANKGSTAPSMDREWGTFDKSPVNLGKNHDVQRTITDSFGEGATNLFKIVAQRRSEKKRDPNIYAYDQPVYIPLYYEDKDSKNIEQLERVVLRVISDQVRPTLIYEAHMLGHTDPLTGGMYGIDVVASVTDEIEDVDEALWAMDRIFENSGSGPMTTLKLVRKETVAL
jgi:hypothetical protein